MSSTGLSAYFLPFLIGVALLLVLQILMPFLALLALAAAFAAMLWPLYARIHQTLEGHNNLAALLTVILVFLCVLAPLAMMLTLMGFETAKLYGSVADGSFVTNLSSVLRQAQQMLPANFLGTDYSEVVAGNLSTYAREALVWVSSHITDTFSSLAGLILNLFVFFVALFFFLRDGDSIKASIIAMSPLRDKDDTIIFDRLALAVNSVVRGNLLIALIRGIFAAIGFFAVGLPNPLLWGVVSGLVGLIPSVGVMLVFVPAIFYIFITSGWLPATGLLLWGVFVVGLIDNALAPQLVGRGMQVHPLLVFLSIFGGITFFGPAGIFLGPLSVSFLFALLSIYASPTAITHAKAASE